MEKFKTAKQLNEEMNINTKSGFFDLPEKQYCSHPEHQPATHLHIPQGKGYKHVCPRCGYMVNIIPMQITF